MPINRIFYEQLCLIFGEQWVRHFYVPARPGW